MKRLAAKSKFPLEELSRLFAPAARAKKMRQSELLRHVKQARRRIWRERYLPFIKQE